MRKKIVFIAVLFGLSCTNNFQSYDLEDIYIQSLNYLFEEKYGILLSPPGPPGTVYTPKERNHQVSNKFYSRSSILKYVTDDKIDVSKFVELSNMNMSTEGIIKDNSKLSKMDVTDQAMNDKRELFNYYEKVNKQYFDYGGTFILGKPLINGDLSNGEVIIPVTRWYYASSKTIAAWIKIKNDKIVKIEELEMQLPMQ